MAVSSTSIYNTPQANDDVGTYTEGQSGALIIDVMANDLGGKAKSLYSLDNGDSVSDLLNYDGAKAESTTSDRSDLGAKIWITSDGRVGYSIDNALIDSLAAGQTRLDKFTYAIRLGNGTLSWATVYVTITGTNDGPTVTSVAQSGAVVEDDAAASNASGTISFNDVDLSDGHSASFVQQAGETHLGSFSLDAVSEAAGAANGSVGWHYAIDNAAAQYLAAGESVTEHYVVTINDGHGGTVSQTVTITISGTNDGPTITSVDQSGGVVEDDAAASSASGTISFNDVDLSDGHSASFVQQAGESHLGSFSLDAVSEAAGAAGGSVGWHYAIDNAAAQHLAEGQSVTEHYVVTVDDGHGGTVSQTVAITITGTNDAPVASDASASGDEDALVSGTLSASDVDDGATRSFAVDGTAPAGFVLNPDGSWSLDAANAAYQHLAAGATMDVTVNFTVADGKGGSDTGQLVITLTGKNDAPVLVHAIATQHIDEDSSWSFQVPANSFADVDDGAVLTYSATLADGSPLPSGLTFDAATRTFTGTPPKDGFGTLSLKVVASDGTASASASFDLVVDPVNDAPVITSNGGGDFAAISVAENSKAVTTVVATDVDGPSLTYSIVGGADAGFFTIDQATGALSFINAPDYEHPLDGFADNIYKVIVRASDGSASDDQELAVTVTNVVEAPPTTITGLHFAPNGQAGNSLNLGSFVADGATGAVSFDAEVRDIATNTVVSAIDVLADGRLEIVGSPSGQFSVLVKVFASDGVTQVGSATYQLALGTNGTNSIAFASPGNNIGAGQGGDDSLTGSGGTDYLFGGSAADKISGLGGNDWLHGGGGIDQFRLSTPAANGRDIVADFTNGTDKLMLLEGGGGWNAAGSLAKTAGVDLAASDYLTIANLSGLSAANNKVAEVQTALSTATITGTAVSGNANAYVLVFNSDSQHGELWYDANWSDTAGRTLLVSLDDHGTLSSVTGMSAADFGEYLI